METALCCCCCCVLFVVCCLLFVVCFLLFVCLLFVCLFVVCLLFVCCLLLFVCCLFVVCLLFVVCCCCCETATNACMSTSPQSNWQGEPSMAKNSSPSRVPKTGAQLQTIWRSAKNVKEPPKKPSHRHMTANRNNVQIFKCELRREVRVHRHDENM